MGYELRQYTPLRSFTAARAELFATLGIDVVIDVGANAGQYGELLRELGFRGRLVSLEPVPTRTPSCGCARSRTATGARSPSRPPTSRASWRSTSRPTRAAPRCCAQRALLRPARLGAAGDAARRRAAARIACPRAARARRAGAPEARRAGLRAPGHRRRGRRARALRLARARAQSRPALRGPGPARRPAAPARRTRVPPRSRWSRSSSTTAGAWWSWTGSSCARPAPADVSQAPAARRRSAAAARARHRRCRSSCAWATSPSAWAVTLLLVRGLGDEGFGRWSTLLAVIGLLSYFGDLGLDRVAVERAAAQPERAPAMAGSAAEPATDARGPGDAGRRRDLPVAVGGLHDARRRAVPRRADPGLGDLRRARGLPAPGAQRRVRRLRGRQRDPVGRAVVADHAGGRRAGRVRGGVRGGVAPDQPRAARARAARHAGELARRRGRWGRCCGSACRSGSAAC